MPMEWWQRVSQKGHFRPLAIVVAGFLAYANSFHGPFVFDDPLCIADNPQVRSFRNLWPPLSMRWLATFTFALNYRLGGLNTFGYHLANFIVHLISALLVYRLVILTLRAPFFSPAPERTPEARDDSVFVAFVSALVFVPIRYKRSR